MPAPVIVAVWTLESDNGTGDMGKLPVIRTVATLAHDLPPHRLAEAEKIYKQILATKPAHVGCLQLLGVISDQRGDHATAVRLIESALNIDPDNVFALISRGNALHALKRFDEARLMTGMMSNSERTSTMTPIPGGGDIRSDGAGIFASS